MATEDSEDDASSEALALSDAGAPSDDAELDEAEEEVPEPVGSQAVSATREAQTRRPSVFFMISPPW